MARGGNRAGKAGRTYANRTDLPGKTTGPNGQVVTPGRPLPVAVPTGGQYGSATAMANAQLSLPMAAPDVGGSATPSLPGAAGGGASPTPPPAFSMPPGVPGPGEMPPLHAPTDRPDEHLMTGVNGGGGAGIGALTPMISHPIIQGAAALNSIPNPPPQVKAILAAVNATLANQGTV
jgi:hypothetical protein